MMIKTEMLIGRRCEMHFIRNVFMPQRNVQRITVIDMLEFPRVIE